MDKQEELLQKRFIELSKKAYQRNVVTYTDFLNLNEQDLLYRIPKRELYTSFELFGGYQYAERQMVAFLPDAFCCEKNYPYSVIKISNTTPKFANKLNHRDYLGSTLNLGIERGKIGDILVDDGFAYMYVADTMIEFLFQNLSKIKHNSVHIAVMDSCEFQIEPKYEMIQGTVSSLRLDSLIALVLKEARNKIIRYIESGKVFVNGKLITTNAYKIQDNDIISVRGFGKFQFVSTLGITKKDRLYVEIKQYTR